MCRCRTEQPRRTVHIAVAVKTHIINARVAGVVAPEGSAAAADSVVTMFGITARTVALGAASGGAATVGTNLWEGQPALQNVGAGMAIGAGAPLFSGEAFFIGAGGAEVYGTGAAVYFSTTTGLWDAYFSVLVPNADMA